MKILFFYKYLSVGGVEALLQTRVRFLSSQGIEAHCWFLQDLGGRRVFETLEDRIQVGDIAACLEHIARTTYSFVVSIDSEEIFVEQSDGPKLPPVILEAHSAYRKTLQTLAQLRKQKLTGIFAPSHHQGQLVENIFGRGVKVKVVPNCVGPSFLGPVEALASRPPRPVVAWIGRLDEHKNWPLFFDIATAIHSARPNTEFWIIGTPVHRSEVQQLYWRSRKLGILRRLRWFQGIEYASMPRLLDTVRESGGLMVTTSRGESFGMAVVEAMARRCPVLVPRQGPFTEYVEHGLSGILYRPGSATDAANCALSLLRDPDWTRRIGIEARTVVSERFSPEKGSQILASRLRELSSRR